VILGSRLFGRLKVPAIAKSALGGVVFGIFGLALPPTMFSGSDQLKSVLNDAGTLGLGPLAATLIAKMLTFAVSQQSGSSAGPSSRRCSSAERPGSSSTAPSPACQWDWRSPACSQASRGRSRPHRSPWC
jgi:hypothetical protein